MDGTYGIVKGEWTCLYRAIDRRGNADEPDIRPKTPNVLVWGSLRYPHRSVHCLRAPWSHNKIGRHVTLWFADLLERKPANFVAVALANKQHGSSGPCSRAKSPTGSGLFDIERKRNRDSKTIEVMAHALGMIPRYPVGQHHIQRFLAATQRAVVGHGPVQPIIKGSLQTRSSV